MKYLDLHNHSNNDLLNVMRINNQYCNDDKHQDFAEDESVNESFDNMISDE